MLTIAPTPVCDVPVLDGLASWKSYLWFFYDRVGMLAATSRRYGPMVVVRERIPLLKSKRKCLIVSGAELNRQVLGDAETYQSGGVVIRGPRGSSLNHLRRGLITVNGRKHQEQRRLVSPLFMPKAIWGLYPKMVESVRQELDTWQFGTTKDVFPRIVHMAMQQSIHNLLDGEDPAETVWLADAITELMKNTFRPGVMAFPLNLPGTPYRRMLRRADEISRRVLQMLDSRPRSEDSPRFLDRLVESHRADPGRVRREDLVGQIVVMFAASHETMPKAVTWALFLLTQHPRILAELRAEIQARCGDRPPTFEALEEMPLLNAVMKETMRVLPPAPVLLRRVRKEALLGTQAVYPGDYVLVNSLSTHRDPYVFDHPNQFRPERWFSASPDSYAYLPFGAGPRTCIAKTLGTIAMNLLVSMIVQRFSFAVAPGSRIDRSHRVTLEPKYGMPLMLQTPDWEFDAAPIRGNLHQMVDLTRQDATTGSSLPGKLAVALPLRRAA
jgi:cytochrome P450